MKLSDYVVKFLVDHHIHHAFVLTGSAVAHVVDSFRNFPQIKYVCVLHEQAGAMAADAYSRLTQNLGVMIVTSGPGATNAITGMCCAWFDSTPMLVISGQVNTFESRGNRKVRQVGFQETEIVDIVNTVTKYAVRVDDPRQIRYHLEKAIYLAKTGRPGPVLIDLPMDVQRAEINPTQLKSFTPPLQPPYRDSGAKLDRKINQALDLINHSHRPVLLVGGGIRLSGAVPWVEKLAGKLQFPIVCSWSGVDVMPHDHPLFVGQMGVYGSRGANFAVQNADLLLSLGSRLDTRISGGRPETYSRSAQKIIVDIDRHEIYKRRGLNPDIGVNTDVTEFVKLLLTHLGSTTPPDISSWRLQTQSWKRQYPNVLLAWRRRRSRVDPYVFVETLSQELDSSAVVIADCGANLTWVMQAFQVKKGQRLFSAFGNSPMGYAFPAAIGASIALSQQPIICLTGDGGLQINIQELQTVIAYKLPLKIFILNNHSYGIIKQFQDMYFGGRHEASDPAHGVTVPDFIKIGRAYGLTAVSITHHRHLRRQIRRVLRAREPILCDVVIPDDAKLIPKLEFGKPIEDLSPLLPRKEFLQNMLISPLEASKLKTEDV